MESGAAAADAASWRRRNGELLMDVAALSLLCGRDFDAKLGNGRE
jgi:hypothetical protein